eukprot:COSAG02_NODE_11846_length_1643_cov_1.500648_1_plen_73_part_00
MVRVAAATAGRNVFTQLLALQEHAERRAGGRRPGVSHTDYQPAEQSCISSGIQSGGGGGEIRHGGLVLFETR